MEWIASGQCGPFVLLPPSCVAEWQGTYPATHHDDACAVGYGIGRLRLAGADVPVLGFEGDPFALAFDPESGTGLVLVAPTENRDPEQPDTTDRHAAELLARIGDVDDFTEYELDWETALRSVEIAADSLLIDASDTGTGALAAGDFRICPFAPGVYRVERVTYRPAFAVTLTLYRFLASPPDVPGG